MVIKGVFNVYVEKQIFNKIKHLKHKKSNRNRVKVG